MFVEPRQKHLLIFSLILGTIGFSTLKLVDCTCWEEDKMKRYIHWGDADDPIRWMGRPNMPKKTWVRITAIFLFGGAVAYLHSPKFTMCTSQIIFQLTLASVLSLATSSWVFFDSHCVHQNPYFFHLVFTQPWRAVSGLTYQTCRHYTETAFALLQRPKARYRVYPKFPRSDTQKDAIFEAGLIRKIAIVERRYILKTHHFFPHHFFCSHDFPERS